MSSTEADVQAVFQLMQHLKVEPEDLLAAGRLQNQPTFEQFMPLVREAVPAPSRGVYASYWNKIVVRWGTRMLNEPTSREVMELLEYFSTSAQRRRNHAEGSGAALNAYYALQHLYQLAIDKGILSSRQNPMARVRKPRKAKSRRHALSPELYQEIVQSAVRTGLDPRLDGLLLRFHLETASRRSGALSLRLGDLDPDRLLITLTEKGVQRLQPVSQTLMLALLDHADERGVQDKASQLLRYLDGRPITTVRYETLWKRIGKHVAAVNEKCITTHWLRHTALTWVERNFGTAVAVAYAGHVEGNLWRGVTSVYVKAGLEEVATALQALTGEPHPLALSEAAVIEAYEVRPAAAYDVHPFAVSRAVTKIICS